MATLPAMLFADSSASPSLPAADGPRLLALDTATDVVHLALVVGEVVRTAEVPGGAQASRSTLPAMQALLAEAGVAWHQLDAIAFGRGPGAFTGLRTACSIAQGLALAVPCPVISIDTLMAIAEDARQSNPPAWGPGQSVWVAQDARMNELYVAAYQWDGSLWHAQSEPQLWAVGAPRERWLAGGASGAAPRVAGNALRAHPATFEGLSEATWPEAAPRGTALAALARRAWARGEVLDAALALPLYVRDKVAQTTAERLAARRPTLTDRPMTESDIPAVLHMEHLACTHPTHAWTEGNYRSSLRSSYWMRVCCRAGSERIVGVCVAMDGVDEMHLLNIAVDKTLQGGGVARELLRGLYAECARRGAKALWLEVRPSNERARKLYQGQGFVEVSVRKGYYPGPEGREDALVMRRDLNLRQDRGDANALV
ncbi:MAG: tRNA (adenosine(37)-N6)-threonylcarbamoyltransferase complex dimerization subunit type 1 TsaB [Burkholderiales bacterium]|nr:tRNA (adenosine(37)-N6)-threonylcarbamoyltransferase complex dimerization subunit type 1 TsaB [Burkholderiales bacterium]